MLFLLLACLDFGNLDFLKIFIAGWRSKWLFNSFFFLFKANMIFLSTFLYENVYILYMAPYEKSNFSWKYLPNPHEFEKKNRQSKKARVMIYFESCFSAILYSQTHFCTMLCFSRQFFERKQMKTKLFLMRSL